MDHKGKYEETCCIIVRNVMFSKNVENTLDEEDVKVLVELMRTDRILMTLAKRKRWTLFFFFGHFMRGEKYKLLHTTTMDIIEGRSNSGIIKKGPFGKIIF